MAAGNRTPNVTALKEEVSNHGRVVVAKAYADWVTRSPELRGASQFINDPPALYAAGIEPVYVPTRLPLGGSPSLTARTTRVKNSVDVKMTADCIECAHSYPNIGIYVLVSGDSDFIHVINSLRAIGKRAIIIGVSWSTSRRLADQVDGLILYDTDVDPETHPEPTPVESVRAPSRTNSASGTQPQSQQLSEVMRVIEDIVRAERQAGRTPLLTSLKQRIMRRIQGFDEKKLGFSGFKKLMLRTTAEGNIKLVTVGLVDWVIMADEPIPQEAQPDSRATSSSIESVAAEEEVMPTAPAPTQLAERLTNEPAGQPSNEPADHQAEPATDQAAAVTETAPATGAELDATAPANLSTPVELGEAVELVETPPNPLPPLNPKLEKALEEALAQLELPNGPGDGLDGRRVADLIIMADTLEHREGVSHVAFNFLIGEICDALGEGLKAEHIEITHRWGGRIFSRTYVTRLVRSLSEGGIFQRGWHSDRDEETGRSRRRRTFNLDRSHPLVEQAVKNQWEANPGAALQDTPPAAVETAENSLLRGDEANNSPTSVDTSEEAAEAANELGEGRAAAAEKTGSSPEPERETWAVAEETGAGDVAGTDPGSGNDENEPREALQDETDPVSAMNRVMRLFRG